MSAKLSELPVGEPVFRHQKGGAVHVYNDATNRYEPYTDDEGYSSDEQEPSESSYQRQPSHTSSSRQTAAASFAMPNETRMTGGDQYADLSASLPQDSMPNGQAVWSEKRPSYRHEEYHASPKVDVAPMRHGGGRDESMSIPESGPIFDVGRRNGEAGIVYRPKRVSIFKYEFSISVFYSVVMPDDGSSVFSSFDCEKIINLIQKELISTNSHLDEDEMFKRMVPGVADAYIYATEVSAVSNKCPYAVSFASVEHEYLNGSICPTGETAMYHVGPDSTVEPRFLRDLSSEFYAPHQNLLSRYQGLEDFSSFYQKERGGKMSVKYDSVLWAVAGGFEEFRSKWVQANAARDRQSGSVHGISPKWVEKFEKAAMILLQSKLRIQRLVPYSPRVVGGRPQCLTLKFTPDANRGSMSMERSGRDNTVTVNLNVFGCIPVSKSYNGWAHTYRGRIVAGKTEQEADRAMQRVAPSFLFLKDEAGDKYHDIALAEEERIRASENK